MIGGIYTDQKCPICGGRLRDDGKKSLSCQVHPQCQATKVNVKFKTVFKRFRSYDLANQFLSGLRFKYIEGTFDARDYQKDVPLGFTNLASKWLENKKGDVKQSSFNNLRNYIFRASVVLGNRNIKEIGYADLEDCLKAQKDISDKTKANMKSALHSFWMWLKKRKVISLAEFPEFPEVKYVLGYRDTVSKETQIAILGEVKRLTFEINPRIWVAVKFLCTYHSIRPSELLSLQEKNIDVDSCRLYFPHPKEKLFKDVPILREDMALLMSFQKSVFPAMLFFRHPKGISGVRENEPFGNRYLWKWWKKACANLGIEGIDLYGGTKHSTVRALREFYSPEEIKRSGKISTNKAFDRYLGTEHDDKIREVYGRTSPDTVLIPISEHLKKDK
jgi:integrase